MRTQKKWYSQDGEHYKYESLDEAISCLPRNFNGQFTIYEGIQVDYKASDFLDGWCLEDRLIESAYDQAGEFAEEWAPFYGDSINPDSRSAVMGRV